MSLCLQGSSADKHLRMRWLCASFAAWRVRTQARALARLRMQLAYARCARRRAGQALGQLRRIAGERKALTLSLRRHAARRALRTWAACHGVAIGRAQQAAATCAHRRKVVLSRALRGWICATVARWAARARAELAARRTVAWRLARSLRAWARVTSTTRRAADAHLLAAEHWRRAQDMALARLVRAWRACAVSAGARAALLAAVAARRRHSVVRGGCLAALAELRRRRSATRAARRRWARRTLAVGLSGWAARLQARRRRSARMELALRGNTQRLTAGAWGSWRSYMRALSAASSRALERQACVEVRWRRAMLVGWRSAAQAAAVERCCVAAAFSLFRAEILMARQERQAEAHRAACIHKQGFRSWQSGVNEVQRRRALLERAARFLCGWRLRSAWQAWACVIAAERQQRIRGLAAERFWRGRRLAAGLRTWRHTAARAAGKRQRLRAASARLRGWRVQAVTRAWRERAALQRCAAWAARRLRAHCLAAWRTHTSQLASLRGQAAAMGAKLRNHTLRCTLHAWVARVEGKALRRARLARGLRHHALCTAVLVWRAWAAHVVRRRQKRMAALQAAQRALRVGMAALRAPAHRRRLAAMYRSRLHARRQASAFAAWAALAVTQLQCRAAAAEMGARALRGALGRAAATGLWAWSAHAATMRAARRLLQRVLTATMRSSFLAWQYAPHPASVFTLTWISGSYLIQAQLSWSVCFDSLRCLEHALFILSYIFRMSSGHAACLLSAF